jgi:hypothetical protein
MLNRVIDFFRPPQYDSIERTQKAGFFHFALFVATGACILLGILNRSENTDLDLFLFIVGGICLLCIPVNKRRAWSEEKARDYIRDRSGKLFDPQVVEAFFEYVGSNENRSRRD